MPVCSSARSRVTYATYSWPTQSRCLTGMEGTPHLVRLHGPLRIGKMGFSVMIELDFKKSWQFSFRGARSAVFPYGTSGLQFYLPWILRRRSSAKRALRVAWSAALILPGLRSVAGLAASSRDALWAPNRSPVWAPFGRWQNHQSSPGWRMIFCRLGIVYANSFCCSCQ